MDLAVRGKYWFSQSIGIFSEVSYKGYSYSSIVRDNSGVEQSLKNALSGSGFEITSLEVIDELEWKLKGVNVSIGLAVKF